MSKLMRMNIFGIRSFGPDEDDVQHIKFQSPLTLIQGQNGCGKTTIIESLKFAITGDLPGGTAKGQGFVYDPKLANLYETRGQVKLRVHDTKGDQVTVTKSVCVNRKASNKLEFKRLDSVISRGKKDDVNQISGKCADIDNEMCLALGVSKPVLNNVIFCHQEDSNWPLEESKKLKEKFDDIFDATKYNKCLESINKYIKVNVQKQNVLKIEVSGLDDKRKFVEERRTLLREKQGRLEVINADINEVETKFEPIDTRIQELDDLELNFNKLYTEATLKKKELSHLKQQEKDILQNITEFQGSDEELQSKVTSFEVDLSSIQSDIKVLELKKQDIEKNENNLRRDINLQQRKLGELQAEQKQNEAKIAQRNTLINTSVKDFDLQHNVIDADSSDEKINDIIKEFNDTLENHKIGIFELEKQLETEEKILQNDIDKIRETTAQLGQNISSKTKQHNEFKNELRQVKHKLEELNTADDQLKLVDNKLSRLDREYTALEASVDVNSLKANIETEKQKYNKYEDQLTDLEREIQTLQDYTSLQTELNVKKESSINKQNELQKLKSKHEKSLSHIFPDDIPSKDLKIGVENYQRTQAKLVKDLNNKINDKQREVMRLESNLNSQREKLNEREKELSNNLKEISAQCQDKQLETVVKEVNTHIEKLQNDRGIYYSSKYLYQKFIKQFQMDEACPVCKRQVDEKEYVQKIIEDLSKKIENFPNQLQRIDKELAESQSKYRKLLGLKPISDKMKKLQTDDVPKLTKEVINIETSLKSSTNELNKLRSALEAPQKNEALANSLMGDATLIDQHQKDLVQIKQEIAFLTSQMPHQESSRGMQEALSEQETLKIDLRTARNNMESLRSKLTQHTERLQKQKELRNELISQQLNIRKNLQDKDHLISKRKEIESKIIDLDSELQELRTQVDPLDKKLKSAISAKDEQKLKNRNKLEQSRSNFNKLKKKIDDILCLQTDIDKFHQKNISVLVESVNTSITKSKDELTLYSDKKVKIDASIDDLKAQVTNRKVYFRELQDNVQLREKRKKSLLLEKEIVSLDEKLGHNNISTIRRERNKLTDKRTQLQEQKHTAEGKKHELLKSITELEKELLKPDNVKAAYNYKRKFLELKLHVKAVLDLKEFVKCMDWSLMHFHRQRMIQINNIIKDLWRSIYKGNDIDYIEIKTDDITTVGTEKRKVYNYRVVQVKNEIELDMRGRCSAGQRVLASLIIRIALADTFSSNCGILALDEPTTNLDRENIHSLAETLIDLINQKKQQKNFQLLIITHDQDFVDRLTRVENMDKYYVITRNEFGKSTITEHSR